MDKDERNKAHFHSAEDKMIFLKEKLYLNARKHERVGCYHAPHTYSPDTGLQQGSELH